MKTNDEKCESGGQTGYLLGGRLGNLSPSFYHFMEHRPRYMHQIVLEYLKQIQIDCFVKINRNRQLVTILTVKRHRELQQFRGLCWDC